jgi:antitoxin component YwqK of YwqJK toxin-antitoxin module
MDENGDLLAVERYRNNVLDGESKYYERGRLAIVGNYRGLNPDHAFDTLYVMDPISGAEKPVVVATERGSLRHGLWRYYDPERGRLLREEEYQVDELIRHKEFAVAGSDSARLNARIRQLPHVHNPRAQAPAYNSQLGY